MIDTVAEKFARIDECLASIAPRHTETAEDPHNYPPPPNIRTLRSMIEEQQFRLNDLAIGMDDFMSRLEL
jgi:hypothetical protein